MKVYIWQRVLWESDEYDPAGIVVAAPSLEIAREFIILRCPPGCGALRVAPDTVIRADDAACPDIFVFPCVNRAAR